jgi:hypothetical protein
LNTLAHFVLMGDVNDSGEVNLADVIAALRAFSSMEMSDLSSCRTPIRHLCCEAGESQRQPEKMDSGSRCACPE